MRRPVAVCGNTAERHGIVLAKNTPAKAMGIKTGWPVWQAQSVCPDITIIPPHYDEYVTYSKLVREIYCRYTDRIESMGIDECWLDVTDSTRYIGGGRAIADEIRQAVKCETGLTISAGVSFNKIFAKLGSDMKKPDAVTEIDVDVFREKIWPLPADMMLGVGRRAYAILLRRGIRTIGDLAAADPDYLGSLFGKVGREIWVYANGYDTTEVLPAQLSPPIKSVGHAITTTSDLTTDGEVRCVLLEMAQIVGEKLRAEGLAAGGVGVTVRDNELNLHDYQGQLSSPTQLTKEIVERGREIFTAKHKWTLPLRSVGIRAINLCDARASRQLTFDESVRERRLRLEAAVDGIRGRYGHNSLTPAACVNDIKIVRKRTGDSPIAMYM